MSKQKYPQNTSSTSTDGKMSVRPIKKNGYTQVRAHAKQDRKRREAYARQDKYDGLSLTEQLETTDPNGSKRQRARIVALMAKAVNGKPVTDVPLTTTTPTTKTKTPKSKIVAEAKAKRPSKS